jgi:hypothetical protein
MPILLILHVYSYGNHEKGTQLLEEKLYIWGILSTQESFLSSMIEDPLWFHDFQQSSRSSLRTNEPKGKKGGLSPTTSSKLGDARKGSLANDKKNPLRCDVVP